MREVIDNSVSDFSFDVWGKKKQEAEKTSTDILAGDEQKGELTEDAADKSVVVELQPQEAQKDLRVRKAWWKIKPVLTAILLVIAFCALAVIATAVVNQMSVFESANFWLEKLQSQWNLIFGRS